MNDATIKKVQSATSPHGEKGQAYLASGKRLSMRLWQDEAPTDSKTPHRNAYETVGYVISGRARLHLEGQTVELEPGDSWLVPADAEHHYEVLEPLTAVEATAPPAPIHGG